MIRKHVLIMAMLACSSMIAWTQTDHHLIQPKFHSYGGDLHYAYIGGDIIRMFGIGQHDIFSARLYISMFNLNGDLLETKGIDELSGEIAEGFTTLSVPFGYTVVLIAFSACDVEGQNPKLALLDPAGEVVWELITELSIPHDSKLLDIKYVESGLFQVADGEIEYFYDFGGDLSEPSKSLVVYDNIQPLFNSGYFFASIDSLLYFIAPDSQVLDSTVFDSKIVDFDAFVFGGLAVLTKDSLHIIDPELDHSRAIPSPELDFVAILRTSQAVWLIADSFQIWQLDDNLQVQNVHELQAETTIRDAMQFGDIIFVAGDTPTGNGMTGMFCLKTYASNFEIGLRNDASIVDIELKDTVHYSVLDLPWHYTINYGRIYVTIANEGVDILNEVTIKFDEPSCPLFCDGRYQSTWQLENLGIVPGDTAKVFLDSLIFYCIPFFPTNICLWTTGPNNEPDANRSNDFFCKKIDHAISLEEPDFTEPISVFPNPATSEINIHVPTNHNTSQPIVIQLINSHGQIVIRQVMSGTQYTVNTTGLTPGLYYVAIEQPSRKTLIKKIVIMRL